MLIRRQDVCVLLLYCCGYSRIRNFFLHLQHKPVSRFVLFHDLMPDALGCFKANLNFLKRCTNVVSMDDYFSGRLSSDKINTVITFDDGFKSWITDAVPYLKKLGLPATFFISSGFVGTSKDDEAEFIRSKLLLEYPSQRATTGGLSVDDVKRIADEGFTIGGHTLNHCNLSKIRNSDQLRYEIAEDKMRLERIIGRQIEYFSYPFGVYHNSEINLTEVIREAGYRGALTTVSGFNRIGSNRYLLHREITFASMHGWVFRARVYGNYDAVRFLRKWILMFLGRQ